MAALPLAEAFTARSLGVMWNNYQKTLGSAPYLGRQKFGTRKQDSLDECTIRAWMPWWRE